MPSVLSGVLSTGLSGGLVGGLIGGPIVGLIGGLIVGLIVGLVGGLIVGLIVSLIGGLIDGLIVGFSGLIDGLVGGRIDWLGGLFVGLNSDSTVLSCALNTSPLSPTDGGKPKSVTSSMLLLSSGSEIGSLFVNSISGGLTGKNHESVSLTEGLIIPEADTALMLCRF